MKLIKNSILLLAGLLTYYGVIGQSCDTQSHSFHYIDFQTDPSGNTLPMGTVIDGTTFAEWGIHFTPSNSNYPLVLFDSGNPTGGDADLGSPSENCPSCSSSCPGESNQAGGTMNCSPLGMIMIIEENWSDSNNDGLEDVPDDKGSGGSFSMSVDGKINIGKVSFVDDVTATVTYYYSGGGFEVVVYNGGLDNDTSVFLVNKIDVTSLDISFGSSGAVSEIEFCSTGSIGDYIWLDSNENGSQDSGEEGINGVMVNLYKTDGSFIASTTTSNHPQNGTKGYYIFENVDFGDYYVQVEGQQGLEFTVANASDDNTDSDLDESNGPNTTSSVSLNHGDEILNVDIGFKCTIDVNIDQICEYTGYGVSCFGQSDGCIKAMPFNGSGSYLYDWSNGKKTQQINNLSIGEYTVTVEDAFGCTSSASFIVTGPTQLNSSISKNDLSCFESEDGNASLSVDGGVGPYDFVWNDTQSQTSQTAINLSADNYSVTVTDFNGCELTSSVEVFQPSEINISASATSSYFEGVHISTFNGNDGEVSVSANGGAGNYTYQWSDPQSQQSATATGLSAGNYSVTVTDASDCSKITSVQLMNPSKLGDFIWIDDNADGIQNNGEIGIEGISITCTGLTEGGTEVSRFTTSDANGGYFIDGLLPGDYEIEIGYPASYYITSKDMGPSNGLDSDINDQTNKSEMVSLGEEQYYQNLDGGLYEKVSLGNYVWHDLNADGIQGGAEPGINNVLVNLFDGEGNFINSVSTSAHPSNATDGFFEFSDLTPGDYYLEFELLERYSFSPANNSNEDVDSDVAGNQGIGTTGDYTLKSGESRYDIDAGMFKYASIGNFVWLDEDEDGEQETLENVGGLNGVKVILYDDLDIPIDSVYTADNNIDGDLHFGDAGYYLFDSLTPGDYYLKFELPTGYSFTSANAGNNEEKDSDVDGSNGENTTSIYNLSAGESELSLDAGLTLAAVPIELAYLRGTLKSNSFILLEWSTITEVSNKLFEIERTIGLSKNIETIGTVNGAGTTYDANFYSYVDQDLSSSGTYYYRLKQIDFNGNFEYTDWVSINYQFVEKAELIVYPNPSIDHITIKIVEDKSELIERDVTILNANGQIVMSIRSANLSEGIRIETEDLNPGIYQVLIEMENTRFYKSL
jgi:hypothetical protein